MRIIVFFLLAVLTSSTFPSDYDSELSKEFNIYTSNLTVNSVETRTLKMYSNHKEYKLKIVPMHTGHVAFAITDIRFQSTLKVDDLLFRTQIVGYKDGDEVDPIFTMDENNRKVYADSNSLVFEEITGAIPVWFQESVDSVKIMYSNSHGLELDQNFYLDDLRIVENHTIIKNPEVSKEDDGHNTMVAIDGSSSLDRNDRKYIYKELKKLLKNLEFNAEDSLLTVVDYGTQLYDNDEYEDRWKDRRELKSFIKKDFPAEKIRYTNWSAALKHALKEKPKTFILMTDGWSNYYNGQVNYFSSHISELVNICNEIKKNGTRLIFITSGMNKGERSNLILGELLNGENTEVWDSKSKTYPVNTDTDILSLESFSDLGEVEMQGLIIQNQ